MPRRKPTSTRQKKADQQLKRAIKRGDALPPEQNAASQQRKPKRPMVKGRSILNSVATQSAKRLQSAFVKLPPKYLEQSTHLASVLPLIRPISSSGAILDIDNNPASLPDLSLSCPRRPKWRFDMTKKEVERNEEGLFEKWLEQTDETLERWREASQNSEAVGDTEMPKAPTFYERNLQVWRQLWRVTEISQIILVLLDSRCPTLHFPPSLSTYLEGRKVILVLTKVDIIGPERSDAWIAFLRHRFPQLPVVQVESYIVKEASGSHQGRKQFEPHLPPTFRERLVEAIRIAHSELLQPPERIQNDPERLKNWISPVKRSINWQSVLDAQGDKVGSSVGGAAVPRGEDDDDGEVHQDNKEPEFLTIGVIGQPNVGKSSLLNALFGAHKVRASKTPGKTKHFQTLFWTGDVRLVDCPGLVMPNFVPMELQVLSGILPISRVAAMSSCIYYAGQLLPLERVLHLTHPSSVLPKVEDKRTWREGTKGGASADTPRVWTATDVLVAYATMKGWLTAKAGRPDTHRAGNAILRATAESRIKWAFWPKTPVATETEHVDTEGNGIWISGELDAEVDSEEDESEEESDDGSALSKSPTQEGEDEDDEDEDAEDEKDPHVGRSLLSRGTGRFGALLMTGEDDESEESSGGEI